MYDQSKYYKKLRPQKLLPGNGSRTRSKFECFEIDLAHILINLGKTKLQTTLVKKHVFHMAEWVLKRDDKKLHAKPVTLILLVL